MNRNICGIIIKFKRAVVFIIMAFFVCNIIIAQVVNYYYDNAGNRVKREVTLPKKTAPMKNPSNISSEIIGDKEIKVFPNPTKGNLRIGIDRLDFDDMCSVKVFGLSGQLIFLSVINDTITDIDITSQPVGIYILIIELNNAESEWKIVKE